MDNTLRHRVVKPHKYGASVLAADFRDEESLPLRPVVVRALGDKRFWPPDSTMLISSAAHLFPLTVYILAQIETIPTSHV